MIKDYKKQVILAFVVVFILFVISMVAIIALKLIKSNNSLKPLNISYNTSNVIKVDNSLPISDKLGKNLSMESLSESNNGFLSFSIKNSNEVEVNYDVFLTKRSNSTIKENYIKLYLTDKEDVAYEGFNKNKIPTYNELLYLNDKPSSKLLYSGTIGAKSVEKLKLRVWVSDSYALSDSLEEYAFNVDVREK